MTQATGQSKLEVFPESETKYLPEVVDAQLTFVKDEGGSVTHVIPSIRRQDPEGSEDAVAVARRP